MACHFLGTQCELITARKRVWQEERKTAEKGASLRSHERRREDDPLVRADFWMCTQAEIILVYMWRVDTFLNALLQFSLLTPGVSNLHGEGEVNICHYDMPSLGYRSRQETCLTEIIQDRRTRQIFFFWQTLTKIPKTQAKCRFFSLLHMHICSLLITNNFLTIFFSVNAICAFYCRGRSGLMLRVKQAVSWIYSYHFWSEPSLRWIRWIISIRWNKNEFFWLSNGMSCHSEYISAS